MNFETKDSGKRDEFETGMVRDTQEGKTRYGLLPHGPLTRLADLYTRGSIKYDDNNWQKGQPFSRAYDSMFRHLMSWRAGDRAEDHLAAVAWNAFALMYYEDNKPELDDLGILPKTRSGSELSDEQIEKILARILDDGGDEIEAMETMRNRWLEISKESSPEDVNRILDSINVGEEIETNDLAVVVSGDMTTRVLRDADGQFQIFNPDNIPSIVLK